MRVLFVFSGNSARGITPFVAEQARALQERGLDLALFPILGKGVWSYTRNIFLLRKHLKNNPVELIHGHFLWSILVCLFQRGCKKIGTFHGSDLNEKRQRCIAQLFVIPFLDKTIVVSPKMAALIRGENISVIPCGVDTEVFHPSDNTKVLLHPLIDPAKKNILFCSRFDRYEKNYPLAKKAVDAVKGTYQVNLIELKDLSRVEVNIILNQVDLVLMTSLWEGSPQVVKEAMACNCPVVTTEVGDVKWLLDGVPGCLITDFDEKTISSAILRILSQPGKTKGREKISQLGLDNASISKRIIRVYDEVLGKPNNL